MDPLVAVPYHILDTSPIRAALSSLAITAVPLDGPQYGTQPVTNRFGRQAVSASEEAAAARTQRAREATASR
ncbi:MAG: hypothetical protein KDB17_17780, partial [Ilumatobacter sp.]|nr:hypothetical protein [Ilumatobacter sp.]